jgi:hypothetical protein
LGSRIHPLLKEIVKEASRSLARLDAERLAELTLSCRALNRDLAKAEVEGRRELERESRESLHDMAIFARVLEATRSNLNVMNRLRKLRASRLEYGDELSRTNTEILHGDN